MRSITYPCRGRAAEITGSLVNKPFNVPNRRPGQTVAVAESAVFDHINKRTDGTAAGNDTEKLISSGLN
ncbi:hypothetical protein [Mycobacterium lacus]|uniref:Uncharacterized protein n=1 Tax=Mycobacterium lacus TaxID=169765 RepID=A0A1X1Y0B4_9MYCO|nr:hypothetical protein [Mycobacterium lacus]MCV7122764.1 hypothetical protein [Mycobacterium lacus]ORW04537.1 hypothetical protein AWC15_03200 [Mycobacterium lacus]BBX96803.1 hypothetical protein MLAC_20970 [Mycobacterium lacus]